MTPTAETLWRWIETYLMKNTKRWDNKLDYGVTVDEADIDDFVNGKFGGYSQNKWFTIGQQRYKMKAFPLQNKNTREEHQYGQVRGGGENKVNVLCYKDGGSEAGFNLHIQVRRKESAARYAKKAARKAALNSGGWATA